MSRKNQFKIAVGATDLKGVVILNDQVIERENVLNEKTKKCKTILIGLIVGCLFLFSGLCHYYMYLKLNRTNVTIAELQSKILSLNEITFSKKDDSSYDDLKKRVDSLSLDAYIARLEHQVEGGVVTDDFVVEKISIASAPAIRQDGSAILGSTIDLSVQPNSNVKYMGKDKFGSADRELKSKIQDVLDDIGKQYNRGVNLLYKDKGLLSWDKGTHRITVNNYEIGTYENGKFTLKGE